MNINLLYAHLGFIIKGFFVLFFFNLMILVVISVLGGRWSERTLWLLKKYFEDF